MQMQDKYKMAHSGFLQLLPYYLTESTEQLPYINHEQRTLQEQWQWRRSLRL
jgi:hypothetical protein